MSKNAYDERLRTEYPTHEEARILKSGANFPLSPVFVGVTAPFSNYAIDRPHGNGYHLLEYLLEGEGQVFIDGTPTDISAGETLFFRLGDRQHFVSKKTRPMKKIWISFPGGYTDAMLDAYGLVTGVYRANVRSYFENVVRLSRTETPFDDIGFFLADDLHRILTRLSAVLHCKTPSTAEKIKNALSLCVYKKVALSEIARDFGLTEATLIRTFRRAFGETPYRFILSEKIKTAAMLLSTTGMSVKEISYLLCFTDEHYFSYCFGKAYGMSPTKYRTSVQKKAE